jgi:hypothetical protein
MRKGMPAVSRSPQGLITFGLEKNPANPADTLGDTETLGDDVAIEVVIRSQGA